MEDWGVGKVLANSDGKIVKVFFADAGEKKISLEYVHLEKVFGENTDNPILDEIENEGTAKYKIGKVPKTRALHNILTWGKIEEKLAALGSASYGQLVIWCKGHDHPSGGRGFVDYCINNGWLVPATRKPSSSALTFSSKKQVRQAHAGSAITTDSGIYVVLLLTEQLMPVTRDPRYVDSCARVNNDNVKIGKARSFEARRQNYWSDFDSHNVEFIPIARLDDIERAEIAIKRRLDRFRMVSPKGGKLEWLVGISLEDAVQAAYDALDSGAFDYEIIKNRFLSS